MIKTTEKISKIALKIKSLIENGKGDSPECIAFMAKMTAITSEEKLTSEVLNAYILDNEIIGKTLGNMVKVRVFPSSFGLEEKNKKDPGLSDLALRVCRPFGVSVYSYKGMNTILLVGYEKKIGEALDMLKQCVGITENLWKKRHSEYKKEYGYAPHGIQFRNSYMDGFGNSVAEALNAEQNDLKQSHASSETALMIISPSWIDSDRWLKSRVKVASISSHTRRDPYAFNAGFTDGKSRGKQIE